MWHAADRVKETSTTTGTGDISLAGAVAQFLAFSARFAAGDTLFYAVVGQSGTEWEVGYGTFQTSGGNKIQRTKVLASSNSDAAVNFSAGTKDVFNVHASMLGLGAPTRRTCGAENLIVPAGSSLVVPDTYAIASGKKLRVESDAVVEIT